jgi:spore maturation protein CgeB
MRIIIVGSDKIYAIENFYKKYLIDLGAEVFVFTAQNYFYEYYNQSIFHKILYRFSLSGIITRINRLFKENVVQFNPDIIWVFKGMEIRPDSLKWAKNKKIKLVNYNPDNPFIFSGRGSGNSNVTRSISLYDLHFTYNMSVKEKLENEYKMNVCFLPFGFDLDNRLFETCANQEEIVKLCFAGNPDKERAGFIEAMAITGIKIDVFGNDWDRFINNDSITIHPPVYGDEFWKILARYRLQLNLMRPHNEDSHNMRSFEVPAVGGIMLAPDTREHRMFFSDGQEVFLFANLQNAVSMTKIILGMSKSEIERIRNNARSRSLMSGYSYKERTDIVFRTFINLLS